MNDVRFEKLMSLALMERTPSAHQMERMKQNVLAQASFPPEKISQKFQHSFRTGIYAFR